MDNLVKWVKIGIAGSAIWTFLIYLLSNQGLDIKGFDFKFDWFGKWDDSLPLVIGGCAVIWLVAYFVFRNEEE